MNLNVKCDVCTLVLELTRRCNMRCRHCLRGGAQQLDISLDTVDALLDRVSAVSDLIFTGGEPSLRWETMAYVLEQVRKRDIPVRTVWLATNGKSVPDGFLDACRDWNTYCLETEWGSGQKSAKFEAEDTVRFMKFMTDSEERVGCYVALSVDQFHEPIKVANLIRLASLPHLVTDKCQDLNSTSWVRMTGRADDNCIGSDMTGPICASEYSDYARDLEIVEEDDDTVFIEQLYVSADGSLLKHCDYAYREMKKYSVGNVRLCPSDNGWLLRLCEDAGLDVMGE